ncbi:hypothetical protein SAMN05421881_100533 [Nitrosomonas halophila]|uniref:Uncharacterized protein n=1 Tax=Nitrosomonas halophila TaxID=44576 RepID=A0A1H3DH66_9PROT|nr:hypothetical protein SAMN05421881_100533 [Nitrosomonas halophila]
MAGRYTMKSDPHYAYTGFNPRPAEWPGATGQRKYTCAQKLVSILAQPNGRALPHFELQQTGRGGGFNPRPAEWPGATGRSHPG